MAPWPLVLYSTGRWATNTPFLASFVVIHLPSLGSCETAAASMIWFLSLVSSVVDLGGNDKTERELMNPLTGIARTWVNDRMEGSIDHKRI